MGLVARDWEARGEDAALDRARAAFVTHLVAMATGVAPQAMLARPRAPERVAQARAMAMYLLHVGFELPQSRVAESFKLDRVTVSQA